jgi:hypothetical protein
MGVKMDYLVDDYCKWITDMIKSGRATIERNVEKTIYVRGKNNKDIIRTEQRTVDVITILR